MSKCLGLCKLSRGQHRSKALLACALIDPVLHCKCYFVPGLHTIPIPVYHMCFVCCSIRALLGLFYVKTRAILYLVLYVFQGNWLMWKQHQHLARPNSVKNRWNALDFRQRRPSSSCVAQLRQNSWKGTWLLRSKVFMCYKRVSCTLTRGSAKLCPPLETLLPWTEFNN